MDLLDNKIWISGGGKTTSLTNVLESVSEHVKNNSKIFIGSDSFISQGKVCFVTAVCLLTKNFGGRYYFYREKVPSLRYSALTARITEEVRRSIEFAEVVMDKKEVSSDLIELHLDVSPTGTNNGTSKMSDMLKGYVQGYGFACKLKPNAWASQTVADKHSK